MKPDNSSEKQAESEINIAMLIHDVKNPLTAILSSLGYVSRHLRAYDEQMYKNEYEKAIDISVREVYRAIRIINNALDSDRISKGVYTPTFELSDISKEMEGVVNNARPFLEAKGDAINYSTSKEDILLYCDTSMVIRAVNNLILNAAQALPEKDGAVNVKVSDDADFVYIEVSDNGCGINKDDLPHIFDCYWHKRKSSDVAARSTGLGLYIVKAVAKQHGGDITAKSEPGKGASFTLALQKKHAKNMSTDNKVTSKKLEYQNTNFEMAALIEMSDLF